MAALIDAQAHSERVQCKVLSLEPDNSPRKSEDEESELHLHTGETTDASTTDLDDTEDEGSDPEYDHEEEESGRTKDHK